MRYLIMGDFDPYYTDYYSNENTFNKSLNMIVFDLFEDVYTDDGKQWKSIVIDNL